MGLLCQLNVKQTLKRFGFRGYKRRVLMRADRWFSVGAPLWEVLPTVERPGLIAEAFLTLTLRILVRLWLKGSCCRQPIRNPNPVQGLRVAI